MLTLRKLRVFTCVSTSFHKRANVTLTDPTAHPMLQIKGQYFYWVSGGGTVLVITTVLLAKSDAVSAFRRGSY